MILYVVRHGQTDYNAEMRFQGRMDIPLNEHGKNQAINNGQALKQLLGDEIATYDFVSSPLGRTRQTMELIKSQLMLPVSDYRLDARLIEISFGHWEGYTARELEKKSPDLFARRKRDKWNFIPPGEQAENYASVAKRVRLFLKSIKQPSVCVCHGGVIRAMFYLINGMDISTAVVTPVPQNRVLKIENDHMSWL